MHAQNYPRTIGLTDFDHRTALNPKIGFQAGLCKIDYFAQLPMHLLTFCQVTWLIDEL